MRIGWGTIASRLVGAALAAALAAGVAPAAAQQPARGLDLSLPPGAIAPPVASSATLVPPTQPFKPDPENCAPGKECGPQLLGGNAKRRGMFEVQVPAWRW